MDEYLFIALAKLKADRLKLEREARAAAPVADPDDRQPTESHRRSARSAWFPEKWFSPKPEWREQS